MAKLDTAKALDVVFDFLGGVVGFLSHFAGRFFLDEAFVADDGLVGDGSAHVVDGAAAGYALGGGLLVGEHLLRNGAFAQVHEQTDVGFAEDGALLKGLLEQADDFGAAGWGVFVGGASGGNLFGCDQLHGKR